MNNQDLKNKIWKYSLYSTMLGISFAGGIAGHQARAHADNIGSSSVQSSSGSSILQNNQVSLSSHSKTISAMSSSMNSQSSKIDHLSESSSSSVLSSISKSSSHSVSSSVNSSISSKGVSSSFSKSVSSSADARSPKQHDVRYLRANFAVQPSNSTSATSNNKIIDQVNALFTDNQHTKLASNVTEQTITNLKQSLSTLGQSSPVYTDQLNLVNKAESMLDNWELRGINNWKYGDLSFHEDGSNELDLTLNGPIHPYYKGKTYVAVTVNDANGNATYNANIIGDQDNHIQKTITLNNGDTIHLFSAEPSRIGFNKDNLKTDVLKSTDFYYQVENNKLVNVTDYTVLKQKINNIFSDSNHDGLAFGTTQSTIDNLTKSLTSAKSTMNNNQYSELTNTLSLAQSLLNKEQAQGIIPDNQIQTKNLYDLDTTSIKKTEAEGRGMGTHHDRQSLGIILKKGATLQIRQTNAAFKGNLTVRLMGDDSALEQSAKVSNSSDWTTITANKEDLAVFVDTPWDDDGAATVEYEVISGVAKKLPDFKLDGKTDPKNLQNTFMNEWNSTQAPYALIEGYNIQILAPLVDINNVQKTDLGNLLHDYDEELFPLYDYLTGITPNKSYNDHVEGRYFAKADIHGAGAAYYGGSWTANNGNSIDPYLTMNWLPWHEIGHGYEFGTKDIRITDVFNNVYGTLFQDKFTNDYKNQSSWLFGNNKSKVAQDTIDLMNNGKGYNGVDFRPRLLTFVNLLSYDKANVMLQLNEMNRDNAVNKSDLAGKFGTEVAIVYAKYYKLNVLPYLKWVGIPVDEEVASSIEQQHYQVIDALCNMVPTDQRDAVAQSLGWNLEDSTTLPNAMSLITTSQVKNLTTSVKLELQVNGSNDLSPIQGRTLSLYDGDRLVTQQPINGNEIDLGSLPDGEYTAVISGNDGWTFVDPYVKVAGNTVVNLNAVNNYILDIVKNLFTDNTYSKIKDSVNLDTINQVQNQVNKLLDQKQVQANTDLINKAKSLLDEIDLSGFYKIAQITHVNNDMNIHINYDGGQPHSGYGNKKYVEIKIVGADGTVKYDNSMIGNQNYPSGKKDFTLSPNDKLEIYAAEGPADNKYSVSNPRLKPYGDTNYVYRMTPTGHLILDGYNTNPVINASDQTITQGANFDPMSNVSANDAEDGVLKDIKVTANDVNVNVPGVYHVTYSVTDSDGATTTKTIAVTVKAETAPVINALDQTIIQGSSFDPMVNVSASDAEDGVLKDIKVTANDVNVNVPGVYHVTYSVTDSDGATTTKTIAVTVKAETAPVINASDQTITQGTTFDPMSNVSANDAEDGVLKDIKVTSNDVNVKVPGVYHVTYSVTDSDGATTTKTIAVTVKVETAPVINASDQTITQGTTFDPMANVSASDAEDGVLKDIKVTANDVNVNVPGVYHVTYSVTDSDGATTTKTIAVTVKAETAPVINASDQTITQGANFDPMSNVSANDAEDGVLKDIKVTANDVNVNVPGVYHVTYSVTDSDGATTTKTIAITVKAETAPVINASDQTITQGTTFDPMANVSANDAEDGVLKDIKVTANDVNVNVPGVYHVTYSVTDSDGATTTKTIAVTVKAETAPVINASDQTITQGTTFDPMSNVSANDAEDGVLKDIKVTSNDVNVKVPGVYHVTYSVTDSDGATTTKTIAVTVKAETAPVINASDQTITQGANFDPMSNVSANDAEDGVLKDIKVTSNDVNVKVPGVYHVTYSVTDSDGATTTKTIAVTVKAETAPVINASDQTITQGANFDPMSNVSASDAEDGVLKDIKVTANDVNVKVPGVYHVTYSVTDSDGATTTKTIAVTVKAETAPVINASDQTITQGANFDPMSNVSANDAEDGVLKDIKVTSNDVNVKVPGVYHVTYSVTDSDGATTTKTITVTVKARMAAEVGTQPTVSSSKQPSYKHHHVSDVENVQISNTDFDTNDVLQSNSVASVTNEVSVAKPSDQKLTESKLSQAQNNVKKQNDEENSSSSNHNKVVSQNREFSSKPAVSIVEVHNSTKKLSEDKANETKQLPQTGNQDDNQRGILAAGFASILSGLGLLGSFKKRKK